MFSFLVLPGSPDGPPTGLSDECDPGYNDHLGRLYELTDADPDTPGFQVDLYDGENYVHVRVHKAAFCEIGTHYDIAVTRAEGSVSLIRPNRPPSGTPVVRPYTSIGHPWVGYTKSADVSSIRDRDGLDNATFSYQWLADDTEIAGATSSSYRVAATDLAKTLKVRVSFTDDRGTEETVTSSATNIVKLSNFAPTGKPVSSVQRGSGRP